MEWLTMVIAMLIALASLTVDSADGAFGVDCWEDEVVVLVVSHPYQPESGLVGTFGCVPADNLPVDGNRP